MKTVESRFRCPTRSVAAPKVQPVATAKATGDLLVTVQVAVPAELTDEQREALESLAATLPSAPREHLGVA